MFEIIKGLWPLLSFLLTYMALSLLRPVPTDSTKRFARQSGRSRRNFALAFAAVAVTFTIFLLAAVLNAPQSLAATNSKVAEAKALGREQCRTALASHDFAAAEARCVQ